MTKGDTIRPAAVREVQELRRRLHLLPAEEYLRASGGDPNVIAAETQSVHRSSVVRTRTNPTPHNRVIVGLREAHQSADALAVGFAEADRRGAALLVNLILDPDPDPDPDAGDVADSLGPIFHAPDEIDVEGARHLRVAVATAGRAFPHVSVTSVVRTGHFAKVLVELSHSADLVVLGVGQRRAGMGRKDLLIASHATCPVVVVRERLV